MTATRAAASIHTALTVSDRDYIDHAKGRALRLLEVVSHVLNHPDDDERLDDAALLDVLDIIREDLTLITATLGTADARRTAGGAR
jgi:hypothetical protein